MLILVLQIKGEKEGRGQLRKEQSMKKLVFDLETAWVVQLPQKEQNSKQAYNNKCCRFEKGSD